MEVIMRKCKFSRVEYYIASIIDIEGYSVQVTHGRWFWYLGDLG